MTVFVVSSGEKHEGGGIIGIFASYNDARKRALDYDWCWDTVAAEVRPNYWENGCDWVRIEEISVVGA